MREFEKLLGTLAGEEEDTRVEIMQVARPNETPTIEFRMQRECAGLGWTTQRRIKLGAGQFAALRDALNMADVDTKQAVTRRDEIGADRSFLRLIG